MARSSGKPRAAGMARRRLSSAASASRSGVCFAQCYGYPGERPGAAPRRENQRYPERVGQRTGAIERLRVGPYRTRAIRCACRLPRSASVLRSGRRQSSRRKRSTPTKGTSNRWRFPSSRRRCCVPSYENVSARSGGLRRPVRRRSHGSSRHRRPDEENTLGRLAALSPAAAMASRPVARVSLTIAPLRRRSSGRKSCRRRQDRRCRAIGPVAGKNGAQARPVGQAGTEQTDAFDVRSQCHSRSARPRIKLQFVPPNPNELLSAVLTGRSALCSR